jgi:hypothetical protein
VGSRVRGAVGAGDTVQFVFAMAGGVANLGQGSLRIRIDWILVSHVFSDGTIHLDLDYRDNTLDQ